MIWNPIPVRVWHRFVAPREALQEAGVIWNPIPYGFGAAEIEQQGLHCISSGFLERPWLDAGLFFNDFHWLRGCRN